MNTCCCLPGPSTEYIGSTAHNTKAPSNSSVLPQHFYKTFSSLNRNWKAHDKVGVLAEQQYFESLTWNKLRDLEDLAAIQSRVVKYEDER